MVDPFLLALVALAMAVALRRVRADRRLALPCLYCVTAGRTGASINYFLEFLAALVVIGLGWAELARRRASPVAPVLALLLAQLLWLFAFPLIALAAYYRPDPVFGYDPTGADRVACRPLDGYVSQAHGAVLAEEAGIVLAHHRDAISSAYLLTSLRGQGLVDVGYARLLDDITQRRFALVLVHGQSYSPELLNAVATHHRKVADVHCIWDWAVFAP